MQDNGKRGYATRVRVPLVGAALAAARVKPGYKTARSMQATATGAAAATTTGKMNTGCNHV